MTWPDTNGGAAALARGPGASKRTAAAHRCTASRFDSQVNSTADRQGQDDEADGEDGEHREDHVGPVLHHHLHQRGSLGDADDGGDRGVLGQRDQHVAQRRDRPAERLRQHDVGRRSGRKDSPIARAASAWPTGTVLMPLRIASATNAAW